MRAFLPLLLLPAALVLCPRALVAQHRAPVYDPARDAARDIEDGIAAARRTGRRVLIEVGGNWCPWCRGLDRIFEEHPELTALRDRSFVTVKVNYSPENKNAELLARYPKIPAYPHFFVLNGDGRLLQSQRSTELGAGKKWDLEKLAGFLKRWAPDGVRPD